MPIPAGSEVILHEEARPGSSTISGGISPGDGASASALAAAQRARIAAGDTAEAWSGLVVLGDGDFVPVPGGRRWTGIAVGLAPAAIAILLAGSIFALARSHGNARTALRR